MPADRRRRNRSGVKFGQELEVDERDQQRRRAHLPEGEGELGLGVGPDSTPPVSAREPFPIGVAR